MSNSRIYRPRLADPDRHVRQALQHSKRALDMTNERIFVPNLASRAERILQPNFANGTNAFGPSAIIQMLRNGEILPQPTFTQEFSGTFQKNSQPPPRDSDHANAFRFALQTFMMSPIFNSRNLHNIHVLHEEPAQPIGSFPPRHDIPLAPQSPRHWMIEAVIRAKTKAKQVVKEPQPGPPWRYPAVSLWQRLGKDPYA